MQHTDNGGVPMNIRATQRLWQAVLIQARRDFHRVAGRNSNSQRRAEIKHYNRDARAWFRAVDQEQNSFIWVCELLKIDPQATRSAMTRGTTG